MPHPLDRRYRCAARLALSSWVQFDPPEGASTELNTLTSTRVRKRNSAQDHTGTSDTRSCSWHGGLRLEGLLPPTSRHGRRLRHSRPRGPARSSSQRRRPRRRLQHAGARRQQTRKRRQPRAQAAANAARPTTPRPRSTSSRPRPRAGCIIPTTIRSPRWLRRVTRNISPSAATAVMAAAGAAACACRSPTTRGSMVRTTTRCSG